MKRIVSILTLLVIHCTLLESYSLFDSDEFIMRWAFQDMCDFVFDPRTVEWAWPTSTEPGGARFNPDQVKPGSIIFVRDIDLFMTEIDPSINVPYVIVTHGEFRDTCKEYQIDYLKNPKILAWFSIHPPKLGHEKFHPLPLGIKQDKAYYLDKANFNVYLQELRKLPKTKLLYLNFDSEQNQERTHLKELLKNSTFCYQPPKPLPFLDYMKDMAGCKFALSPRGWGPDCYRTWEALYVGTIPVVRRCQFDQLLVRGENVACNKTKYTITSPQGAQLDLLYQGLPIVVIDEWEELTEEFLNKKYEEITAKQHDITSLYMPNWRNKIREERDRCLKHYQGKHQ
jgi:hypothetical protein